MAKRTWPRQVETTQIGHHGPPHLHPQKWLTAAVATAAEQAEVGRAAAAIRSRAALAVHPAGSAHELLEPVQRLAQVSEQTAHLLPLFRREPGAQVAKPARQLPAKVGQ